jgi:hypothetical protein
MTITSSTINRTRMGHIYMEALDRLATMKAKRRTIVSSKARAVTSAYGWVHRDPTTTQLGCDTPFEAFKKAILQVGTASTKGVWRLLVECRCARELDKRK